MVHDRFCWHIKCLNLSFTIPATFRAFDGFVDSATGLEKWNRSHHIPASRTTVSYNTACFPVCGTVIPRPKIVGDRAAFTC